MHYTSIEQSEKLLELGLNPNSADMCYCINYKDCIQYGGNQYDLKVDDYKTLIHQRDNVPCWSLGALVKLLPERTMLCTRISDDDKEIFFVSSACFDKETDEYVEPIDAAYEFVVWLLENGYINNKN